jgi:hypothetical protein
MIRLRQFFTTLFKGQEKPIAPATEYGSTTGRIHQGSGFSCPSPNTFFMPSFIERHDRELSQPGPDGSYDWRQGPDGFFD